MLQNVFDKLYGSTAGTYFLSDNYRSKQPITVVADMIRSHRCVHRAPLTTSMYLSIPCASLYIY
jgi:hypothetical protein